MRFKLHDTSPQTVPRQPPNGRIGSAVAVDLQRADLHRRPLLSPWRGPLSGCAGRRQRQPLERVPGARRSRALR